MTTISIVRCSIMEVNEKDENKMSDGNDKRKERGDE